MWQAWKRWRRSRIVQRATLDEALWRATLARVPFMHGLSDAERARLREMVLLFLHCKSIHGAGGLEVDDGMRLLIAAQACLLILNLDIDFYRGWVEIIVYPAAFVPRFSYTDEAGVVHVAHDVHTGEAWLRGPIILSWADIEAPAHGDAQIVLHEFAHKLDMLNGDANGYPPLHRGMSRKSWSEAWEEGYADFCRRLDLGESIAIDEYAAESPAEFFAVMSEAFFATPRAVNDGYPRIYEQLRLFYLQHPLQRMSGDFGRAIS